VADLGGRVVAFLEARRSSELADLIRRHNGVPLAAPCLRELHQADRLTLARAIEQVCQPSVGFVVFLTGVGVDTIFQAARLHGTESALRQALARQQVAVRGPKPAAALRRLGVAFQVEAPPPHTTAELLGALEGWQLAGATVAVQLYGEPHPRLREALETRGAQVVELAPYVWLPPENSQPLLHLLDELDAGRVDALLVTSQAQVDNLFGVARAHGRRPALERIAVGAQGPVVADALRTRGVEPTFLAQHGHMGSLILAAAEHFAFRSRHEREP
jgi:uroporphyrinogen-III synthase